MISWFMKKSCKHEFVSKDIQLTGFKLPEKPKNDEYQEWVKYYSELYESPGMTQRVKADCAKCKKTFYAHCGLDLIKHGKLT